MTLEEKVSIVFELENLVGEWLDYIENIGNECSYTDSIIEKIKEQSKLL